jgi:3-oxoacyl-(acyl-carrier-protein) synthase
MTAYIESIGDISRCVQSADELTELLNGGEFEFSDLPIEFDSQIPLAKMRRNSRYNKLACIAADNAVRKAAIPETMDRRRIGTIISTGYGSSVYNSQFADTVAKGVPGLCSPAIYSGTVPNACVGQICILNGFKGASTVLTGGDPLEYSALLINTNKADMILCGSVEEYNPDLYSELRELETLKGCDLSEGAAMFVLSKEKTEKTLCAVTGFSSASLGKSPLLHRLEEKSGEIISDILKKYDNTPDAVFTAANGTYFDDIESKAIKSVFPEAELVSPKNWAGETLGCGYMMNVMFAAAAVNCGKYSKVLVTGVDLIGNYCTAMIERA